MATPPTPATGAAATDEQLLMRCCRHNGTASEIAGGQGQRPRGTVVDTKAIDQPVKLGGMLEEASRSWRQWNYSLELWLTSQFPETRDILT